MINVAEWEGIMFDGRFGLNTVIDMIQWAIQEGFPIDESDRLIVENFFTESDLASLTGIWEIADEAENWVNDNAVGGYFEWHEGDFFAVTEKGDKDE